MSNLFGFVVFMARYEIKKKYFIEYLQKKCSPGWLTVKVELLANNACPLHLKERLPFLSRKHFLFLPSIHLFQRCCSCPKSITRGAN